jgi:hypothetical protein
MTRQQKREAWAAFIAKFAPKDDPAYACGVQAILRHKAGGRPILTGDADAVAELVAELKSDPKDKPFSKAEKVARNYFKPDTRDRERSIAKRLLRKARAELEP